MTYIISNNVRCLFSFPQNLVRQMELLNKSKSDVSNELNRSKEDNEELKFQVRESRSRNSDWT